MLFRDKFEIKPTQFLDGHTDPNSFDLIKWHDHKPMKVLSITHLISKVGNAGDLVGYEMRYDKEDGYVVE